jgi:PhnB protein
MTVNPIPDGFHTITPNIIAEHAEAAIDFYKRALGAEEVFRLTMPDGAVTHCELRIGDSRLNIGQAMEGWPAHTLLAQIHVADSDALFQRAVEAGATVIMPMTDMFFGLVRDASSIPSGARGRSRRAPRWSRPPRCSAGSTQTRPERVPATPRSNCRRTTRCACNTSRPKATNRGRRRPRFKPFWAAGRSGMEASRRRWRSGNPCACGDSRATSPRART